MYPWGWMCSPTWLASTFSGSMKVGVNGIIESGVGSIPNKRCSIVTLPTTTASYVFSGVTPVSR